MSTLWHYFWPGLVACAVIGVVAGALAFRSGRGRRSRNAALAIGGVFALAAIGIVYGPLSAATKLSTTIEARARALLLTYEMAHVQARLERGPLTRRLVLSGAADDFQRGELKRMMEQLPGVAEAVWDPASLEAEPGA